MMNDEKNVKGETRPQDQEEERQETLAVKASESPSLCYFWSDALYGNADCKLPSIGT